MKRKPKPGEAKLVHFTEQSEDEQEFALSDDNYDPLVIGIVGEMLDKQIPIRDFTLLYMIYTELEPPLRAGFCVFHKASSTELTQNTVEFDGHDVRLTTRVENSEPYTSERMNERIMAMAADLEQCAAVAIVKAHGKQIERVRTRYAGNYY